MISIFQRAVRIKQRQVRRLLLRLQGILKKEEILKGKLLRFWGMKMPKVLTFSQ